MNKKELKAEILKKISIMETNSFLFPHSWSDEIELIDYDWKYKTYHAGYVGDKRYHNFEIIEEGKKTIKIEFRDNDIEVMQNLEGKSIHMKDVLFYIDVIFKELHSFKNHSAGRRAIRKEITEKKTDLKRTKKEIEVLYQKLIDSKNIDYEPKS